MSGELAQLTSANEKMQELCSVKVIMMMMMMMLVLLIVITKIEDVRMTNDLWNFQATDNDALLPGENKLWGRGVVCALFLITGKSVIIINIINNIITITVILRLHTRTTRPTIQTVVFLGWASSTSSMSSGKSRQVWTHFLADHLNFLNVKCDVGFCLFMFQNSCSYCSNLLALQGLNFMFLLDSSGFFLILSGSLISIWFFFMLLSVLNGSLSFYGPLCPF